jgi:hypothetical protein
MGFLRFAILFVVVFFVFKFAIVSGIDWYDGQSRNPVAVAAGFTDYKEQDQAKAAGFSDPAAYRAAVVWIEQTRKESEMKKESERIAAAAALAEYNRNPAERMDIATNSWTAGGFGVVGVMNLTVTNNNDYPVKDISVKCTFNGKSGTEVSSTKHTIYESIKARAKKAFRDVNVGFIHSQAARGGCTLVSASRM